MKNQGLERAPVSSLHDKPRSRRAKVSLNGLEVFATYDYQIRQSLSIGQESQFVVTAAALRHQSELMRQEKIQDRRGRTISTIAELVVASSVELVIEECRDTRVLDIGCGEARFGEELTRVANADVTSVDSDPEILKTASQNAGEIMLADGRELPFADESFDKTFNTFASISYAHSPLDAVMSLNESLRVTKADGTVFMLPICAPLDLRKALTEATNKDATSVKMFALQDHVIFQALRSMMSDDYISVTWAGMKWVYDGMEKVEDRSFDMITAVIDKQKPIPPEVFAKNIAYVNSFNESPEGTDEVNHG